MITDAEAIALLSAEPTCSGTAAQFTPAGLQDHAQIKAFVAPAHFRNWTALRNREQAGVLETLQLSQLSAFDTIFFSACCCLQAWNKDAPASKRYRRCQRSKAFLEHRQRQVWPDQRTQTDANTTTCSRASQYRCQLISKKDKNRINLQVCFGLFPLMETGSRCSSL